MAAAPAPLIRLLAGTHGSASKVEAQIDGEWQDISHLCARAVADVSATEVTTITIEFAFAAARAEGVLDSASLDQLERIVKAHREAAA